MTRHAIDVQFHFGRRTREDACVIVHSKTVGKGKDAMSGQKKFRVCGCARGEVGKGLGLNGPYRMFIGRVHIRGYQGETARELAK